MEDILGTSLEAIIADIIAFIPNLIAAIIIFLVGLYNGRLGFKAVERIFTKRAAIYQHLPAIYVMRNA